MKWTTMDSNDRLPFKAGQQAESKSFLVGFRGAWFRCEIKSVSHQKDQIKAFLEYFDFPGEKIHRTKLYQKPSKHSELQLILRPCFPAWYHESHMPDLRSISDVIVIVDDVWMVGDLVDWFSDGCYWSGRVTHLLGNDKVQVELPDPPIGEGKSYEAFCKDLRPSLDWSPECGWMVPISTESETCRCCARLVLPLNEDKEGTEKYTRAENTTGFASCEIGSSISSNKSAGSLLLPKDKERKNKHKLVEYSGGSASCETGTSISSSVPAGSLLSPTVNLHPQVKETSRQTSVSEENEKGTEVQSSSMKPDSDDSRKDRNNFLDKVSCSHEVKHASDAFTKISSRKDQYNSRYCTKRTRISECHRLTSSTQADAIESSIVELEELANKIRWLKGLLHFGLRWSNAMKPSWKFLETCGAYNNG